MGWTCSAGGAQYQPIGGRAAQPLSPGLDPAGRCERGSPRGRLVGMSTAAIEIVDLHRSYGPEPAVSGVSFSVASVGWTEPPPWLRPTSGVCSDSPQLAIPGTHM